MGAPYKKCAYIIKFILAYKVFVLLFNNSTNTLYASQTHTIFYSIVSLLDSHCWTRPPLQLRNKYYCAKYTAGHC